MTWIRPMNSTIVTVQETGFLLDPRENVAAVSISSSAVPMHASPARREGGRRTLSVRNSPGGTDAKAEPLVSIITVVYNGGKTLEQCIRSVLVQSYGNIQYIIIDGGSRDNTLKIIESYEERIDYWVSERDGGIYDAMNKGLQLASGDYIGMLNADDWLEPNAIEMLLNAFRPGIDFVYGDVFIADEDGRIVSLKTVEEPIVAALPYRMPFPHQTFYVRREVIKVIRGYDTHYRLSADLELVCRVVRLGFNGAYAGGPIATFRSGGASGGITTFLETRAIATKYGMGYFVSWLRVAESLLKVLVVSLLPAFAINRIRRVIGSSYKSTEDQRLP